MLSSALMTEIPRTWRGYGRGRFGQMHYRRAQPTDALALQAPMLLCFHLSPVSSIIYERFLPVIGRSRPVLAADTPGYGLSDPPPDPPEIEDFAAAMADLLDDLGEQQPVDVLGYHTGCKIAVSLARTQPHRVRRLILFSAPVYSDAELEQMRADHVPPPPQEDGSHLVDVWQAVRRWKGPGQTPELAMESFPWHLMGGKRGGWGHRAAFRFQHADHLPHVDQPVMVINPDDDLTAYTRRAEPLIKTGRYVERPDWGHGVLDVDPAGVAALVDEFLTAEFNA